MKCRRKGFTLIEIIIVLSIASIITTAVIMAAAGAQRNSRDATRRAATQRASTAFEAWAANHNGALPTGVTLSAPGTPSFWDNWNDIMADYLDMSKFKDPSTGLPYNMSPTGTAPTLSTCSPGNISYVYDNMTAPTEYSMVMCLESGIYTFKP